MKKWHTLERKLAPVKSRFGARQVKDWETLWRGWSIGSKSLSKRNTFLEQAQVTSFVPLSIVTRPLSCASCLHNGALNVATRARDIISERGSQMSVAPRTANTNASVRDSSFARHDVVASGGGNHQR